MRRVVLLLTVVLAAAGCGGSHPSTDSTSAVTNAAPAGRVNATAPEIQQHAGRFAGATVVVAGGMGHRLGPHAFTIAAGARQATPATNAGLLVVAKTPPQVRPGRIVLVTGKVLLFRPGSAKRQIPYAIDVAKLEPFNRHPVVVATRVAVRH